MRMQLFGVRAFRAEMSARDRRIGIAFNLHDLAIFVINDLATAHAAIWADRARNFTVEDARQQLARLVTPCSLARGAEIPILNLFEDWPAREQGEHVSSYAPNVTRGKFERSTGRPRAEAFTPVEGAMPLSVLVAAATKLRRTA